MRKEADPVRVQLIVGILGFVGILVTVLATIFGPIVQESLRQKNLPTQMPIIYTATPRLTPSSTSLPSNFVTSTPMSLADQVSNLKKDVVVLKNQVTELERTNQRLDSVDERLSKIERAILDDPSKAIDTVILRRDIEGVRSELALLRNQQSESKGLTLTTAAFVFSSTLAFFGLLFPVFRPYLDGWKNNKANKSDDVE